MSVWCEHCRGHFPEDHYVLPMEGADGATVDNALHGVGLEYGPVGRELAVLAEAGRLVRTHDEGGPVEPHVDELRRLLWADA